MSFVDLSRDSSRSGREHAEDVERATLSARAVPASESKGRERPEPPDPHRTAFQVDRDRVLRSAAFARLADKAVNVPTDQHPSRLRQVTCAAALAGWLARSLQLNADLVEAIAHASVLGAPPFAGAGEEALTAVTGQPFALGEQSLRVVERLEGGGAGLNLTWEVRDGLVHAAWAQTPAATWEGQAVRLARRVAEVVDAWVAAGRPQLPPLVQRELGHEPDAVAGALLGDVLATAGSGEWGPAGFPDVLGGELPERHLPAITEIAQRAWAEDEQHRSEHERAVHVVSSLVVYEAERTGGTDLRGAVDRVASWSDGEALAAYRTRFEPAG
jgi:hypothetical protein